jgi:CubicO group peptidase (beta-lactamase class C family)
MRTRLEGAFDVLAACVERGLVPGAVAAVGTPTGTLHRAAFGWAELSPNRRPMTEDALFDVASLTKVVVTTTLLLRYVERGRLFLDQRVADILPSFAAGGKGEVTLRHLMTHTSGLPAWRDLRRSGPEDGPAPPPHDAPPPPPEGGDGPPGDGQGTGARQALLERVYATPLERPPGTEVVYSDLGFITLGAVLATAGGASLDVLARQELFEPAGMSSSLYCPGEALRPSCVATEVVADRGGTVVGAVHDENAAALGGVSGHAGLFTTCGDLERFCRLWLGRGRLEGRRLLSPASVSAATRDQTGLGARRGLGWVLPGNAFWVPADLCSPQAYSHTGFTGTSLLLDPELERWAVLLTNRVHPTRGGGSAAAVKEARARFHNTAWAALTSS